MEQEFLLPIHPSRNIETWSVFDQIIQTLNIISIRIKMAKEKLPEDDKLDLIFIISLDIKSLFIFIKTFLDYLIRYISETFFEKYIGKGLKIASFDKHVRKLRNPNFNFSDEIFTEYKEFLLSYESRIFFKIINIKDKLMTHLDLKVHESWLYDGNEGKIFVLLSKKRIHEPIDKDLRDSIIKLAKKFNIKAFQLGDFFYYDKILDDIENLNKRFSDSEREKISQYRIKLGVSINEENIIDLIQKFCKGLCIILQNTKEFPFDESIHSRLRSLK